jgi:peptidoglycan hydrolase-like protein with peptidoglycan-binding domain
MPKWFERGDEGDGVKELQARLNRDYPAYSNLTEDGIYGPATEAVVREFQRRAGLTVNGIAGPETLVELGLD